MNRRLIRVFAPLTYSICTCDTPSMIDDCMLRGVLASLNATREIRGSDQARLTRKDAQYVVGGLGRLA